MAEKILTVAEIEAQIAQLEKQKRDAIWREEEAARAQHHATAVEIIGRLTDDIRKLAEIGYLPPKLMEALSDKTGKFNPGMFIKKPKEARAPTPTV